MGSLFENLLGKRLNLENLLRQLAYALEDYAGGLPLGNLTLHLNPQDYEPLKIAYPHLESQLLAQMTELARQMGVGLPPKPRLTLLTDARQQRGRVSIQVAPPTTDLISTAKMLEISEDTTLPHDLPLAQFLQNQRVLLTVERPIINIGRHADNHLVLDDPHVSRHHCQLRWRHGNYVLYDLDSRHGLFVNDQRVSEHLLRNGDWVTVGKVRLLFLLDAPTDSQRLSLGGDTQPTPP